MTDPMGRTQRGIMSHEVPFHSSLVFTRYLPLVRRRGCRVLWILYIGAQIQGSGEAFMGHAEALSTSSFPKEISFDANFI